MEDDSDDAEKPLRSEAHEGSGRPLPVNKADLLRILERSNGRICLFNKSTIALGEHIGTLTAILTRPRSSEELRTECNAVRTFLAERKGPVNKREVIEFMKSSQGQPNFQNPVTRGQVFLELSQKKCLSMRTTPAAVTVQLKELGTCLCPL
jgi:hypothetical protein